MAPLKLGASHFVTVMAGIVLVFTFIFLANPFNWAHMYAELAIKRFERSFGFAAGNVVIPHDQGQWRFFGVVIVPPLER